MTVTLLRSVLGWCTCINYGLLLVWAACYRLPHAWMFRLWRGWFNLADEQFDQLNFIGLTIYKLLIFVFNVVPYVALRLST